jgi:hypothetical protein
MVGSFLVAGNMSRYFHPDEDLFKQKRRKYLSANQILLVAEVSRLVHQQISVTVRAPVKRDLFASPAIYNS